MQMVQQWTVLSCSCRVALTAQLLLMMTATLLPLVTEALVEEGGQLAAKVVAGETAVLVAGMVAMEEAGVVADCAAAMEADLVAGWAVEDLAADFLVVASAGGSAVAGEGMDEAADRAVARTAVGSAPFAVAQRATTPPSSSQAPGCRARHGQRH